MQVINELWEALCLCQFHDTLPGSVIRIVQDDINTKYAWFFKTAKAVLADAAAHLASRQSLFGPGPNHVTRQLVNPLPTRARLEVVQVPTAVPVAGVEDGWELGEKGKEVYQTSVDGENRFMFARCGEGDAAGDLCTDVDYHEVTGEFSPQRDD